MSDDGSVLAAIARLDGRFDHIDERIDRISERIDRISERIERVEQRLGEVEATVQQLRVDVMGRLDRQQDDLTRIRDDIGVNYAANETARERNNQFRNEYNQLASQVSLVHRRLRDLEQRFDVRENGT